MSSPIKWTPLTKQAFEDTKRHLAEATLLAHPVEGAPLILRADASDAAMCAALKQFVQGKMESLGFFSRKFADTQAYYSAYDRELQAVFSALKFFRHMAERRKLTIVTDHKPLIYAFRQRLNKASPRQQRQLDFISQLSTDITSQGPRTPSPMLYRVSK